MMLILIMVLKFKSTDKFHRIRSRHHFEDNENMKLPLSWQPVTHKAEIQYVEVIYDTDFDYGIQISVN